MHKNEAGGVAHLPPGFQHQGTVGQGEANLSQPDASRARVEIRVRVHHDVLQMGKYANNLVHSHGRLFVSFRFV